VRASLFLNGIDPGAGGALHRTLVPWTDAATWADSFGGNGVQADGVEALAQADATVSGSTGAVEIDVTEAVAAQLGAGGESIAWAILPLGVDGWDIVSCEGAAALRPRLSITVEEATCVEGDVNCDGAVDGKDLAELLSTWGGSGPADINADGFIDGNDLSILIGAWTV
jgi:hypothetical protein